MLTQHRRVREARCFKDDKLAAHFVVDSDHSDWGMGDRVASSRGGTRDEASIQSVASIQAEARAPPLVHLVRNNAHWDPAGTNPSLDLRSSSRDSERKARNTHHTARKTGWDRARRSSIPPVAVLVYRQRVAGCRVAEDHER